MGGVRRIFWGVMYYIGKINTGVPPGLGGYLQFWGRGRGGLYKSLDVLKVNDSIKLF